MNEEKKILEDFLNDLANKLKSNIPNVSGDTANSISVSVSVNQDPIFGRIDGKIEGANWIWTLEFGRPPTRTSASGTPTLRENILRWIKLRGIIPEIKAKNPRRNSYDVSKLQEGLSWAISNKIHKEGTRLYRDIQSGGSPSGVISNIINDDVIDNFIAEFSEKTGTTILNNIVKTW